MCTHIGQSCGPSLHVRLRSDARAHEPNGLADSAVDARADASAHERNTCADFAVDALTDARADDRRSGCCAVECVLEHPLVRLPLNAPLTTWSAAGVPL